MEVDVIHNPRPSSLHLSPRPRAQTSSIPMASSSAFDGPPTPIPRPGDSLSFNPLREHLNPKFESYRLRVPTDPRTTTLHTLPAPGIKPRQLLPEHARLSFSEVQNRVRHNHLSVGLASEVVYVDGDLRVMAITLDAVSFASIVAG